MNASRRKWGYAVPTEGACWGSEELLKAVGPLLRVLGTLLTF